MLKGFHLVVCVGVSAIATAVRGVAMILTGGLGHSDAVIVSEGFLLMVCVGVPAVDTGVRGIADTLAGGIGYIVPVFVGDRLALGLATSLAGHGSVAGCICPLVIAPTTNDLKADGAVLTILAVILAELVITAIQEARKQCSNLFKAHSDKYVGGIANLGLKVDVGIPVAVGRHKEPLLIITGRSSRLALGIVVDPDVAVSGCVSAHKKIIKLAVEGIVGICDIGVVAYIAGGPNSEKMGHDLDLVGNSEAILAFEVCSLLGTAAVIGVPFTEVHVYYAASLLHVLGKLTLPLTVNKGQLIGFII